MKNKSSKWKRMLPTELKLIGSVTMWTCTGTLVCRHCRVERKSSCALPMSPPGTPYCRSFCSANNETIFEKIGLHVSFPSVSFDTMPGRTSISCPTWWKVIQLSISQVNFTGKFKVKHIILLILDVAHDLAQCVHICNTGCMFILSGIIVVTRPTHVANKDIYNRLQDKH